MMAFNVARALLLFCGTATASITTNAGSTKAVVEDQMNPIRRVVSLLQNMAKKIEAEAKSEQELYDKFMCYCKTSGSALEETISSNTAAVPQIQSDIEEAEAKQAATKQELLGHQEGRDEAKATMEKATAIREKEHAEFLKESGGLKVNIGALSKAIPAIEKGMAGGFLQTNAAKLLRRVAISDTQLTNYDRDALTAFLSGGTAGAEGYVPSGGQVVGILKQMLEDFEKDLAGLEKVESDAQKVFDELIAAKTSEVQTHTEQIERKTGLLGELGVSIVHMKNSMSDAESALVEDQKFIADLQKNCGTKKAEWSERVKTRADELAAIAETIKILNDDDALELFKKVLPSPSLLQIKASRNNARLKALAVLRRGPRTNNGQFDFIALALEGKKVDFTKVLKMIDDMVALLAKEQSEDEHKQEYCEKQLDFAEDKGKELSHSIANLETTIEDAAESIKALTDDLASLNQSIVDLDKSVLDATVQRKKEHEEYTELMSSDSAAKELLEFAKNRLNKFYSPKLYKPPPKRELTEEERIYSNMGGELEATPAPGGIAGTGVEAMFLQVQRHKDAPPPPPEMYDAYAKKSEESGGVISMIDLLIRDLDKEMTEADTEEKDAQSDYEEMLDDSARKRADAVKAITEKESAKADAEETKMAAENAATVEGDELAATKEYEVQLHNECDWLLQNFDIRKEARKQEVDALKEAKAILSGADFSLVQRHKGRDVQA